MVANKRVKEAWFPVTCDECGFVTGFSHHDGFLDGVLTDAPNAEAHLAVRSISGERRVLTLRQVAALHVDSFREGNIVSSLRCLPSAVVATDDAVRTMLAERLYLHATDLPSDGMVFVLESSFGAAVVAVCREVEVSGIGVSFGPSVVVDP